MIYLIVLADATESVRHAIGFNYDLSIECAPFEALYGRKCRLPGLSAEIGESSLTRLERKPLEFEVGDHVLLKVMPWKDVVYFGKKGKLAPRYVGPFEILERIGLVAYRLRLPEELNSVHDTFHVSNLKKCLADANLHVPLDEIKVDKTLCFVNEPVEIMDQEIKKLKRRKIALVKVRWNSKRGLEFTWEHEDQMRIKYPQLFVDRVIKPASAKWFEKVWYRIFTKGQKTKPNPTKPSMERKEYEKDKVKISKSQSQSQTREVKD
ncbi:hypothetical protein Tco_0017808 [Tanacetum coccineum]